MIAFKNLTLTISPNSAPKWNGTLPMQMYKPGVSIITTHVPLTQVDDTAYEWVELELWVDEAVVKNETEMRLTGLPYSVRLIDRIDYSTIITRDKDLLDDIEDLDDYNVIQYELFSDVVAELFSGTGWTVKIDAQDILDFPVITETSPIMTLNGSRLNQLNELLSNLSADGLWGQGLTFFVNIFSAEIIVATPTRGESNVNVLAIEDIAPKELIVSTEVPILPEKVYVQEGSGCLYRHEDHLEDKGLEVDSYNYETTSTLTEADADTTELSAKIVGERTTLGGLVLAEFEEVLLAQRTTSEIKFGWGQSASGALDSWFFQFEKNKVSQVITQTNYEYLLGPPYSNGEDDTPLWSIGPDQQTNNEYTKSLPGSRQQINRQLGAVRIDKDNHPDHLLTTDGIRVLRKVTRVEERELDESSFNTDTISIVYPGQVDLDSAPLVTTETEEVFAYDDSDDPDEQGNLIGDRVRKVVTGEDEIVITETFRTLNRMSDEQSTEMTYSVQSKYTLEMELKEASVTDIGIQVVSSGLTGPTPTSVYSSSEGTSVLRDKLILENASQILVKADEQGNETTIKEAPTGTIYLTIENLLIEEIQAHIEKYYVLKPQISYKLSFTSEFLDVRGIIGGYLRLTSSTPANRDTFYKLGLSTAEIINMEQTGLFAAMAQEPFRTTGISISWEGGEVPEVAMALCQLL